MRQTTGIEGLDEILHGGFVKNQSYLISGNPGAGKTLLGIEYLLEGAKNGEQTLYINLGENLDAIHRTAEAFGFPIEEIEFLDLSPTSDRFANDETYSIFSPAEVERETFTEEVTDAIDSINPSRVVIDPVTQFRHLAPDEYQFRQQFLAFLEFLIDSGATVLFTSQSTTDQSDEDLSFLGDGTLVLDSSGATRQIEIKKFRSSDFQSGTHSYEITDNGLEVYPTLMPGEPEHSTAEETLSSGVPEIDALLSGGIERGTATVVSGPSGVGKTTFGTQFTKEAAGRGERSAIYMLEETADTFRGRCEAINIPVSQMEEQGILSLHEIDALSLSANEFAHLIRTEVEEHGTDFVLIDGVQGYRQAIQGTDEALLNQLHALIRYLKNSGVTVILTSEVPNVTGDFEPTDFGGSYLADTLIFLRHVEIEGRMRKAIGVLKKRTSDYERTLREFHITEHGIKVGDPLTELRGVLTGQPEIVDEETQDKTIGGSDWRPSSRGETPEEVAKELSEMLSRNTTETTDQTD